LSRGAPIEACPKREAKERHQNLLRAEVNGEALVLDYVCPALSHAGQKDQIMISRFSTVIFAASALALSAISAQAASGVHIRGTIEAVNGQTMTVKTREGSTDTIDLGGDWKITGVAKASVHDIKPGDFVGIASVSKKNGGNGALEVVIFPASMKGTGEGDYAWDLKPKSNMTNGTVANAVEQVNGQTVTVSYRGGSRKITITDKTPVVTFVPAKKSDLKPNAPVFVGAKKDGTKMSAQRVIIGHNGVVPPM
jgi:hypothetical protein